MYCDIVYHDIISSSDVRSAFPSSIIHFRKVEWRSVFMLVTQRSVRHPSGRRVWPVRPSERLKPPDGTWATSYKRACCRARAPWHDGSLRLGSAWHGNGRMERLPVSIHHLAPYWGGKSFWGCERTSSWQHVTDSSYMAPRYVFIFVAVVVGGVGFFFRFFFSSRPPEKIRRYVSVGDLGHARKTKARGEIQSGDSCIFRRLRLKMKAAMRKKWATKTTAADSQHVT